MTERAVKPTEQHRHRAAQIWYEPQHAHKVIDCELAESIAHALAEQPATPPRAEGVLAQLMAAIESAPPNSGSSGYVFIPKAVIAEARAALAHAPSPVVQGGVREALETISEAYRRVQPF